MGHIAICESYLIGEHRLNKPGAIVIQPYNMVALTSKCICFLCWWHKHMNWVFWRKILDNFDRWNHITISRNNYGNVAAFGKHIR